jgi:UDP-N-acetylglucosamine acyltransferase
VNIHPTAVISSRAQLASDVGVGPYTVIEADAKIGEGCEIAAHVVIKRFTELGKRNRIFEHAVLGGEPQDLKFKGEKSRLLIGDDNLIREFCTLHRGCGAGETTRIGSRNFFMVGVHVAHNSVVGDDNIFTNGAALAGHIEVEDHVFLSNNVGCHQFVRLGRYAIVGGKSKIVQDVLPFFLTDGNPARVRGINSVGLRRAGFSSSARLALKTAHQLLFRSGMPLENALLEMDRIEDENVSHLAKFIRGSKRGFTRAARHEESVVAVRR